MRSRCGNTFFINNFSCFVVCNFYGQISKWILQHPLHTACMISWFIALTCVIIESLGEPSIQFMTAAAVICVVALIFLGIVVFQKLLSTKKRADSMAFGSFSLCCYTCGKRVSVSL